MKRIAILLAVAVLVAAVLAMADQNISRDRTHYTIYRNIVVDTVVADSGGLTWFTDAAMTQGDHYWTRAAYCCPAPG